MDFTNLFTSLSAKVGGLLPGVLGAIAVLIIGMIIASIISGVVRRLLKRTSWDDKLFSSTNIDPAKFFAKLVYYIIMVMVLLVVLEMLGVSQVLDPLKNMVGEFVNFLPRLIGAGVIGFVGYVIATLVSDLVSLGGNLFDTAANKFGLDGSEKLINIAKKVVFMVIFGTVLIAALDVLKIEAISVPAKELLSSIIGIIPNLIACVFIITIFFIGGKYIAGLVNDLLVSLGTDSLGRQIGIQGIIGQQRSLSGFASGLLFFFIALLGVITGVERLGFEKLTNILNTLLELGGQIAFGLVILAIGNFLANKAKETISSTDPNAGFISNVVKYAILGMFLAIALSRMGIANDIVNLAFGLTLGAFAIVIALAYGLGGREAAGRHFAEIIEKFKK